MPGQGHDVECDRGHQGPGSAVGRPGPGPHRGLAGKLRPLLGLVAGISREQARQVPVGTQQPGGRLRGLRGGRRQEAAESWRGCRGIFLGRGGRCRGPIRKEKAHDGRRRLRCCLGRRCGSREIPRGQCHPGDQGPTTCPRRSWPGPDRELESEVWLRLGNHTAVLGVQAGQVRSREESRREGLHGVAGGGVAGGGPCGWRQGKGQACRGSG
mmetsp:Transcript_63512/g.161151  ORF Transcript_63512/g.161151 Transcript_63512/m.161151 type:complete len:212 (-) Transcript_63512:289-924(-)